MVAYARQTLDTPNPIARFAHRRRYSASLAFTTENSGAGRVVLDYGCGEGDFLNLLKAQRPDLDLIGFDPYSRHDGGQTYRKVTDPNAVTPGTVDVVTCFETLEHLDDTETSRFLDETDRFLAPHGALIVSVPIMGGPPLILKETNRSLLHRKRTDYTAREFLSSTFLGKPAPRPDNIKTSHKGFDFQAIPGTVGRSGYLEATRMLSPFSKLPWWMNSQAFWVFRRQ